MITCVPPPALNALRLRSRSPEIPGAAVFIFFFSLFFFSFLLNLSSSLSLFPLWFSLDQKSFSSCISRFPWRFVGLFFSLCSFWSLFPCTGLCSGLFVLLPLVRVVVRHEGCFGQIVLQEFCFKWLRLVSLALFYALFFFPSRAASCWNLF